jgi:hypothetical protein
LLIHQHKSSQLVVSTNLDSSQLIVVPTEAFGRVNTSQLSMGSNNAASFTSPPRPMRGDGHPITYRTTRQKYNDEQIIAREKLSKDEVMSMPTV